MAVVTAAVAVATSVSLAVSAVGTAVTAGTMAATITAISAVATAAVNIGTVVGLAGMVVSGIGAVTGNESLMSAGQMMGYVGMAAGVGGGLLGGLGGMMQGGFGAQTFMEGVKQTFQQAGQNFSQAWNSKGMGSWFPSLSAGGAAPAAGAAPGPVSSPQYAVPSVNQAVDASIATAGTAPTPGSGVLAATAPPTQLPTVGTTLTPETPGVPMQKPGITTPGEGYSNILNQSSAPPQAGNINFGVSGVKGNYAPDPSLMAKLGENTATGKGLWESLPDYMKYSLMTTGGQGLTGAAQGYFQGLSAEEQVEFQRLVQAQQQAQLQRENRNSAYAPLVSFSPRPGAINSPGGRA